MGHGTNKQKTAKAIHTFKIIPFHDSRCDLYLQIICLPHTATAQDSVHLHTSNAKCLPSTINQFVLAIVQRPQTVI